MKAVILAAGKGSRINEVSKGHPKSLLELGNTTLLGKSLSSLEKSGIKELILITGYKKEEIENYVREKWKGICTFIYNPIYETTNVLYSFSLAIPHLDSDFIFLHADTVFEHKILERLLNSDPTINPLFAIDKHSCEEEEMKVKIVKDLVIDISKEIDPKKCHGEFIGLARIPKSLISPIKEVSSYLFEQGKMFAFFESAIQELIFSHNLKVEILDITGLKWCEVDFPEDYERACGYFS